MTEVEVPQTPALSRVSNVELMHTGTWMISTGPAHFTVEDLIAAVAALGCPAVRRPVLKLGHIDPRFDGEPAVGYVANMRTAEEGRTLVGDYAGMPGWLGPVLASAWPDRSIEGEFGHVCQMEHTHPFVVHAVALLGVSAPGIGSLESLQDVAQLFGVEVNAATGAAGGREPAGTPVIVRATGGTSVPNPSPRVVAANVTTEDVVRTFYGSELGQSWDIWIEELQLDPLQLIYIDDADGWRYRVPITVPADATDPVFGDPVRVVLRYDDAETPSSDDDGTGDGAQARAGRLTFASRAESRPGTRPVSAAARARVAATEQSTDPSADPAAAETTPGGSGMELTDEQVQTLRTALGIADDVTLDGQTLVDAVVEALSEQASDGGEGEGAAAGTGEGAGTGAAAARGLPEGTVAIERGVLDQLRADAAAGQQAHARQQREDRERLVDAAVRDGRIAPARRDAWAATLAADPGAADTLAQLAPGLIPVEARGHDTAAAGGTADPAGGDNYWFAGASTRPAARKV